MVIINISNQVNFYMVYYVWFSWVLCFGGTGIRGLMRGMATLPKELLVVRDKVGRPQDELGVCKSMECDIFPSVL